MRILGIDPGSRITGFGVIDVPDDFRGQTQHYVASGVIKTSLGELPERIAEILDGITEVIATYQPTVSSIEKVFVNVNPAEIGRASCRERV